MGFGGGGSSETRPHTHDSNIANDGGALQFNNVTQGGMAAGDVTYSDGNHLQILAYPAIPAGETLTAAAASTAPSWVGAGGGGIWEFVEEFTLGVTQPDFDCVFASAIDLADYNVMCQWWIKNEIFSNNMEMRFNGQTGVPARVYINGNTAHQGMVCSGFVSIPADSWCIGSFVYYGNTVDTSTTMGFMDCTHGTSASGNLSGTKYQPSFRLQGATTQFTQVTFMPTLGNQYAGNYVRIYRMKVN